MTVVVCRGRKREIVELHANASEVNAADIYNPTTAEIKAWADATNHTGEIIYSCTDEPSYPYRYRYGYFGNTVSLLEDKPLDIDSFTVGLQRVSGWALNTSLTIWKDDTGTEVFPTGTFIISDSSTDVLIGQDPSRANIKPLDYGVTRTTTSKPVDAAFSDTIKGFRIVARGDATTTVFYYANVKYKDGRDFTWIFSKTGRTEIKVPLSPHMINAA